MDCKHDVRRQQGCYQYLSPLVSKLTILYLFFTSNISLVHQNITLSMDIEGLPRESSEATSVCKQRGMKIQVSASTIAFRVLTIYDSSDQLAAYAPIMQPSLSD